MVQKPETTFRQWFDKRLDKIPNSWFESISQKSIRATPDKLGCVKGNFVALEFKKDKNEQLMRLQEYKKLKIIGAEGIHFTPTPQNAEEVLTELNELAREKEDV